MSIFHSFFRFLVIVPLLGSLTLFSSQKGHLSVPGFSAQPAKYELQRAADLLGIAHIPAGTIVQEGGYNWKVQSDTVCNKQISKNSRICERTISMKCDEGFFLRNTRVVQLKSEYLYGDLIGRAISADRVYNETTMLTKTIVGLGLAATLLATAKLCSKILSPAHGLPSKSK